jgi:uncharacterized membrane-anchored protein
MLLGARYWTGLSIASVFGADIGDFISHYLHLGHWRGVLPLTLVFLLVLRCKREGWLKAEVAYWLAVVIVRAGATNLADLASHDLDLNNPMLIAVLALLLILGVALPLVGTQRSPHNMQPGLPDTRGCYWLNLFVAGALGTVLGDDMSDRFDLLRASLLLSALLACLFLLRQWRPLSGKSGYWTTVLGARTAGTSVGDLIADQTPLGLAGSTAAIGVLMLVVLMSWKQPGGERSYEASTSSSTDRPTERIGQ